MDTAYVFNLVDLSFLIERFFDFSEKDFWTKTQSHLDAYRNSGITDSKRIDLVAADVKKKIMNGGTLDWFNHQVANELHRSNK